jgi:chromosome segregation ATPase
MRRTFIVSLFAVMAVCALRPSIAAPQARPEQDVLTALLVEVRGLRAAIEQLASAGPRVQLSMGRLQLQAQRIATLARRADEIRDRRVGAERELSIHRQQVASLQEAIQRGRPLTPEIEHETRELEAAVNQDKAVLAALQNEEIALNQEIAAEQGRWSEINQRLEELDRLLSKR